MQYRWNRSRGLSLLELVATAIILAVMAALALPFARIAVQRQKEAELRRALRILRTAIDDFHRVVDPPRPRDARAPEVDPPDSVVDGYPRDLEVLVRGITVTDPKTRKSRFYRFLRRIPRDPMTGSTEWGKLCIDQLPPPESWYWCGRHVYDVFSLSKQRALDGSYYYEW